MPPEFATAPKPRRHAAAVVAIASTTPPGVVAPNDKAPALATLSPHELLVAAQEAKDSSTRYVLYSKAKPANTDRLTALKVEMDAATDQMTANKTAKGYRAADVVRMRNATRDMQNFLHTKDD